MDVYSLVMITHVYLGTPHVKTECQQKPASYFDLDGSQISSAAKCDSLHQVESTGAMTPKFRRLHIQIHDILAVHIIQIVTKTLCFLPLLPCDIFRLCGTRHRCWENEVTKYFCNFQGPPGNLGVHFSPGTACRCEISKSSSS